MWYFSNFPSVDYAILGGETVEATDITRRFRFVDKVLQNKYIVFTYFVKEGMRPDMVAYDYYKDEKLDWLVMMTNKILDPYFQWPVSNRELDDILRKRYKTLAVAKQTIKKRYQIIQQKETTYDGFQVPEKLLEVDATFYNTLPFNERKQISLYDWEVQENEKRKTIKLIDKSFLPQILNEAERLYDS